MEMEGQAQVSDSSPVKVEDSSKVPRSRPCPVGDRTKRDEWSEGAVACLLNAYESKWVLRNRAKLKGHDWEDVAHQVSSRANATKSFKTPTQCKNKIESMKKRYRSESASGSGSRWPLFPRLDGLVRCRAPTTALVLTDQAPAPCPPSQSLEPNGMAAQEERIEGGQGRAQISGTDKESDHDTPSHDSCEEKQKMKRKKKKKKKKRNEREEVEGWEVMESVQWLAEATLRVEQARMDTMREVEKIRAQAEAKRGEMDLKRTEIIANTQLQIAKLLAKSNDSVDSSLRIGRG